MGPYLAETSHRCQNTLANSTRLNEFQQTKFKRIAVWNTRRWCRTVYQQRYMLSRWRERDAAVRLPVIHYTRTANETCLELSWARCYGAWQTRDRRTDGEQHLGP